MNKKNYFFHIKKFHLLTDDISSSKKYIIYLEK